MLRDAIFLATYWTILLLRDVKLANMRFHYSLLMYSSHIKHPSLINISSELQEKLHHTTWASVFTLSFLSSFSDHSNSSTPDTNHAWLAYRKVESTLLTDWYIIN